MSKRAFKIIGVVVGVLVLVAIIARLMRDDSFDILVRSRPSMTKAEFSPVAFGFTKAVRPTQIKVVEAESAKTNKYPRTLWHLVAAGEEPRSVKGFFYGDDADLQKYGLLPKTTNAVPEPLEPGVEYLIMIQTDSADSQTNFTARAPRVMPFKQ